MGGDESDSGSNRDGKGADAVGIHLNLQLGNISGLQLDFSSSKGKTKGCLSWLV